MTPSVYLYSRSPYRCFRQIESKTIYVKSTMICAWPALRQLPARFLPCLGRSGSVVSPRSAPRRISCDAKDINLPVLLSAATFEFAFIAFDLQTDHRFSAVDTAIHDLVLASTSDQLREDVAAQVLSNLFPIGGFGALTLSTLFLLFGLTPSVKTRLGVAWGVYISSMAAVGVLKEAFARPRPSADILHSFAFPSGHTCAANVLTGLTLFVLLDPVWDAAKKLVGKNKAEYKSSQDELGRADVKTQDLQVAARPPILGMRISFWIFASCTTATGRIEGNRHWLSDTMGGAALGVIFVCLALMLIQQFEDAFVSDGID